jgi:hypothetical protein
MADRNPRPPPSGKPQNNLADTTALATERTTAVGDAAQALRGILLEEMPGATEEQRAIVARDAMLRFLLMRDRRRSLFHGPGMKTSLRSAARVALQRAGYKTSDAAADWPQEPTQEDMGTRVRGRLDLREQLRARGTTPPGLLDLAKRAGVEVDQLGKEARRSRPSEGELEMAQARAGVLALLAVADLSTQDGADRIFRTVPVQSPPKLEQLRLAYDILRALEDAIVSGNKAADWKLIRRAHASLFSEMDARSSIVVVLKELRKQCDLGGHDPQGHGHAPESGPEVHAAQALGAFAALDPRFETLSVSGLLELVRDPSQRALGIATKLSLRCGAFDDSPQPHEDERKAFRRVRRLYEKAAGEVPT